MRAITLSLLWLVMTVVCAWSDSQEAAGQRQPIASRPSHVHLDIDISLDKAAYEVGEPIRVSVQLTNTGATSVKVKESSEFTGRHDGYVFEVRRRDGEPGELLKDPGHEYISSMSSLGSSREVQPGKTHTRELLLNYRVPPLQPGRYQVRCLYQPLTPFYPGQHLQAESASLSFEIVETTPAAIRQRILSLTREIKNGGNVVRLLGFTGDPAAIPPLLNVLLCRMTTPKWQRSNPYSISTMPR